MRAGAHTPGNWTIDHERIGPPGEPVALLCDMTAPHGATVVDWPRGDGEAVDDAENEANARLIAAAPDLLAALEAYDQFARANDDWDDGEGMFDFILKARAAIAKATGEAEETPTA
jgi:hypothetical protein